MLTSETPQIVAAERLNKGLVIKFDNGRCGFYSSALLFSKILESDELDEADIAW